ncbi:hypothetical protein M426DRAFT_269053 [Hypoxylon sp. CI-4A]|nr:hypothetical protein M426DRAFT_269053 [Hypoxylon sp. CI-4A]
MAGLGDGGATGAQELETIMRHVNFDLPPSRPGREWLSYPEFPTAEDLNPFVEHPQPLPNHVEEPWERKDSYIEAHYRLQREEGVKLLRDSVKSFIQDPFMADDEETCIYTRVYVKGYLMTRFGPMCQVQFSTERSGKKIRWTNTRRLTAGTLVVLSTASDGFRTIRMPAVITIHRIRDGLDQNPPTIYFQWTNLNDSVMNPSEQLVMIENRGGYFEAVRHSMVGLQHVANTENPLDKYLVHADKGDRPARYVQENPHMDIRALVHHIPDADTMTTSEVHAKMTEVGEPLRSYPIIDGFDDDLSQYTNLDNSQLSAVHRILTKELAIVQGPPGTGKTFTSVQALKILLASQEKGSNAIIVAAQTNHAVDQILTQLINADFKVVRLGGRTQNEVIKRYSMYNLRQRAPARLWGHGADRDYKACESARKRNVIMLERIIEEVFANDLLNPEALHSTGVISDSQLKSIQAGQAWVSASRTPDEPAGVLAEWLGDQLVRVKRQDERDPDFDDFEEIDEDDLEEEEYDLEHDDCIIDEDEDGRVDGKFLPITHLWTGANPRGYTETDLIIRRELRKSNLWDIDHKYRGAIYQYWQKQLLSRHRQAFCDALVDNARIVRNLKVNRWYKDTKCIKSQQIEIIGCTTTGLCKYRGLLAAMRPRTMLIEEAAETREANILSALYSSLQQLILVGDHQQLTPHCDIPLLAEPPFNMRVSMFERLVKLEVPFSVLNMQRRMIPSLREILNPFYQELQDHPVVTKPDARPPIPGMDHTSFFFHHTWADHLDENLSRNNILEAEMVVHFIDYLMLNGVDASQITVLTYYRGQKKKILAQYKSMKKNSVPFNNVFTVDSYQGEENDIIILSLVRSNGPNGPHNAGFLRDKNRGVVAISRARRGFYIFGNVINLRHSSDTWRMWGEVYHVLQQQGRCSSIDGLPIVCQKHGRMTFKAHPEDWIVCHGGCDLACPETLDCGHACGLRCHWLSHDKLICRKPCERKLPCGHPCQQVCGENCVCTCAEFTGAYSHDDFPDASTHQSDVAVEYNKSRVAPFISSDQRRAGAAVRGRGNQRPLDRDFRPGLGYINGDSPTRNDQIQTWANFNFQLDDKQKSEEARDRMEMIESQRRLIGGPSGIQDTFHPVTLDNEGGRNVGVGITTKTILSPDKDEDLLSFDFGPDEIAEPQSEAKVANARSASAKMGEPGISHLDGNALLHRGQANMIFPLQSEQHRRGLGHSQASTGREANEPEWDATSAADVNSAINGEHLVSNGNARQEAINDDAEDDLITL